MQHHKENCLAELKESKTQRLIYSHKWQRRAANPHIKEAGTRKCAWKNDWNYSSVINSWQIISFPSTNQLINYFGSRFQTLSWFSATWLRLLWSSLLIGSHEAESWTHLWAWGSLIHLLCVGDAPVDGLQSAGTTWANDGQQDHGTATPCDDSPHHRNQTQVHSGSVS